MKRTTFKLIALSSLLFALSFTAKSQTWQELDSLSNVYIGMQSFDKAFVYAEKAAEIVKNEYGETDTLYADRLISLLHINFYIGNYKEGVKYAEQEKAIRLKTQGNLHEKYSTCISNLGVLYSKMGQYDKVLPLYMESLEICEQSRGKEHSCYGIGLNNLAILYLNLGQYEKSISLFLESLENCEKIFGKDHFEYGKRLSNLSELYKTIGQYDKALLLSIESLKNCEKALGKQHSSYGISLNNLAELYKTMGQYSKALPLYLEALENTEKSLGKEHSMYGSRLNNLAGLYSSMGEYHKALDLYIETLDILEKTLGKEHQWYGYTLTNFALLYSNMGQYDKALPLYKDAIKNNYHNINQVFSFLSEIEKEKYVITIDRYFNNYKSFFADYYSEKPELAADMYDLELTIKGMILQSGIQMRQSILNSNNAEALNKYDDWISVKTEISKQYSIPPAKRSEKLSEMEAQAEKLEGELTRISSDFRLAQSLTSTKWKDVQRKLEKGEACIEFSAFNYYKIDKKTDSIIYIALVLTHDSKEPILVKLFEENDLKEILNIRASDFDYVKNVYSTKGELYGKLWEPIEKHLQGINTIYISPSGLLHKLSFSAITSPDNKHLSDKYTIRQVATTGQIKTTKENIFAGGDFLVSLFGGINYNAESSKSDIWAYLEGTKTEADKIEKLLKKGKIQYKYLSGNDATESEFKLIAGRSNVLHIATHGFFYPNPDDVKRELEKNTTFEDVEFRGNSSSYAYETFITSKNPLMRSGLVFAGSNNAWEAREMLNSEDDGILTAQEVMQLNLQNTNLVVLSACETGLGDIYGSEGVYGLQRAFKSAGAKSLIMSLWQVPDKETAEFMETFYAKLLKYKDIHQAFSETQRKMRQKYDPFFWAAFVLVE